MFNKSLANQRGAGEVGAIIGLLIVVVCFLSWFTHLYVCFNEKLWGFLIAGAIMFPIAIIHGFGIWLGIW